MFKKTLFAVVTATLFSGAAFNASADDQGHGTVNFTGTVITAPCSVAPESSNIDVWLGQVADSVLNGSSDATAADFSIHLIDCTLVKEDGEGNPVTTSKVDVTFSATSVNTTDTSLINNTKENNYGGAKNVGVRILDADYNKITLGQPLAVNFTDVNSPTQNLDFHARMESPTHTASEGDVAAQATYVLNYQ